MNSIHTRSIWPLIRPEPLATIALLGAIGRVYAVAEPRDQPPARPSSTGARPAAHGEAETALHDMWRLKLASYRHRHA